MSSDKQEQQQGANARGETEAGGAASGRAASEEGLEAEQESAAAMDSDVPQPPEADETTEGQPS